MSQQELPELWYDFEQFASMTGFHDGLERYEKTGQIKWTNTATDMDTGGVHGLRYKVEKDAAGHPQIVLQHWVHWPSPEAAADDAGGQDGPQILTFATETRTAPDGRTQIRPVSAEWMGKSYTAPADLMKIMHLLQETAHEIKDNIARNTAHRPAFDSDVFPDIRRRVRQTNRRDEIPNLYHLAQRAGFRTPFTLKGMYYNGEFNFAAPGKSEKPPSYALQLLRPMLGLEAEITDSGDRAFSRSFTMPHPAAGGYEGVTYDFRPSGDMDGFEVSCRLWSADGNGGREETALYRIAFAREAPGSNMYRLENLEMLGHRPDLTDHKGVARAVRAMKYVHLAMQRGEAPVFSDIIHEHSLKLYLSRPEPPAAGPQDPRISVQVFGANTDAVFSEREKSIGSNGMILVRDFMKDGHWVRQGVGVDWGVTFGDGRKDYYHSIMHNYGRFLKHPGSPDIKPFVDTIVSLETHEHEDHLRGIARFAKFGYEIPPLVLNRHTQVVLRRMMTEEKVPAAKIKEIMARCHVVKIDRYEKPAQEREVFAYGDTVIEQTYETIASDSEKKKKYFPVLEIYSRAHPDSRTRVRVGPAGHSAHALMFEVDGVLYTGDYKLDQTVPRHLRTDLDWLAKCRETAAVHVQESTNAAKMAASNPPIAEVKKARKKILAAEAGGRIFYDTIGSNAIDIEMFCRAAGEVRREAMKKGVPADKAPFGHIVFAGAAVRNKYRDLNDTDDFKRRMREEYGIQTLHMDAKSEKVRRLLGGSGKNRGSYIVVMTGTQDEPLSLTHRISRDLHDLIRLESGDAVIRGQAPIPGENREKIRREQNNRYRHDFGCRVYDAQELAKEGTYIYTSSHASQDDYRQIHEITGDLLKILHHGGPRQLESMKKIMDDAGARAIVPDKQALYRVDRAGKTLEVIGETPEERVGYREIRDDEDEFYKKQRQQGTVIAVKDRWQGEVAERMYRYEERLKKREEEKRSGAPTSRGANIAGTFNAQASGADFPAIGIMHRGIGRPYHESHKNIRFFVCHDAETTGANPEVDVHTDIGFVAATPDGKKAGEKVIRHALAPYMMPTLGALMVTKNGNPQDLYRKAGGGLPLRRYAHEMFRTFRDWPQELAGGDKTARAVFAGYRNGVFDDQITMRMMGMALAAKDMKPMATHGNLQLDVYNLYSAMVALCPGKVKAARDKDGNAVRTLREACLQNGIPYDDKDAHGSLYDAGRTMELMTKLRQADPDVFEQMLMNCDFSSSRRSPMLDHILGQDLHLNGNAPVFGYVDMRDRKCVPRLGALVTIDTLASKATDAIVIDVAKADIHQIEQLSDQKLLELMNDPEGPFAVLKLNNSPCWFPPQFIFRDEEVRSRAAGDMPKTTLQARANALKKLQAGAGGGIGNNFIQRVQRLYPQSTLWRRGGKAPEGKGPGDGVSKTFRLPGERIFSLFHVIKAVNTIKNKHYKKAAKLLRDIQPTAEEFKRDFHRESFWKDALHRARELSEETRGLDPYIEDLRFLIEWQADDINPRWLPEEDRRKINALKSSMLHGPDNAHSNTVDKFRAEMARIESNPADFERLVGRGTDAKKRWKALKGAYTEFADAMAQTGRYAMNERKRERLREYRRSHNQTDFRRAPRPS